MNFKITKTKTKIIIFVAITLLAIAGFMFKEQPQHCALQSQAIGYGTYSVESSGYAIIEDYGLFYRVSTDAVKYQNSGLLMPVSTTGMFSNVKKSDKFMKGEYMNRTFYSFKDKQRTYYIDTAHCSR
ncbi:hypothetical protein ACU6ZT_11440 [Klebsiella aerogenes]